MNNAVDGVLTKLYDDIKPADVRLLRKIGVIKVCDDNIAEHGSDNLFCVSWENANYNDGIFNELRDLCNLGIVYVYEDSLDVLVIRAPTKLIPTYKRIVELGMVERLCEEQSYSEDE